MRALQLKRSVVALLLVTLLGAAFTGCQTPARYQRETALLRAEILDLEDQFYSMKSRYDAATRELQVCRGTPIDGNCLGSTSIEGECIDGGHVDGGYVDGGFVDGGFVDGGYVDGPYIEGPIIDSSEYGPADVVYDGPTQTGRYIPQATATMRDSARRIFGRGNASPQSQSTQRIESPRRSFGLFNGRGLGLFRGKQAAEPVSNFSSDVALGAASPPRQPGALRGRSSSTPTLATDSTRQQRAMDAMLSEPLDAVHINLDIPFADGSTGGHDGLDDPIRSQRVATNGSSGAHPVTQIDISSGSTRGEDVDGQPGDEGVVVLIQPKDRNGVLIKESGEVTVSLIDPGADHEGQRIGLWKFTPQEMRLFEVKNEHSEQGYLLHLPWDGQIPSSQDLLLYVRYWTNDGRRLETSTRLSINPPANGYSPESPLIEGWTRRDPRWDKGNQLPPSTQPSMLADDPGVPDLKNSAGNAVEQRNPEHSVKATPASSTIRRPAWRPSR